jgi:hypothetical protein
MLLVAAIFYFAVDVIVFLAIDGIAANPIPRAEQRPAVLERREALLLTIPDRHRRPAMPRFDPPIVQALHRQARTCVIAAVRAA